jgi:alginate O-acetyltransferase complex protein AlgI
MIFTSLEYLIFLPIVFAVFWAISHQHRWAFLLVVSYVFYIFWKAEYALIMLTLTIVDYFAGIRIANAATRSSRRLWLAGSIVANLSMLFFFKYYNFAASEASALLQEFGSGLRIPLADIILPLGISFHTFQAMGYTLDVYHNHIKPEKHIGYFALFIAYFPQIVAGPIERAGHLLVQLKEQQNFSYERAREGFFLIRSSLQ